jgi:hypothetical protein
MIDLDPAYESMLVEFLHEHWEIFAWCPSDMPGVLRELVEDTKCGSKGMASQATSPTI